MDLSRYAVLASLSLPVPPSGRVDKEATSKTLQEAHAGQNAGRFVKNLYPKQHLEPLRKAQTKARQVHEEHSLPWPVGQGVRMVPLSRLEEYREQVIRALDEVRREVNAFTDEGNYQHILLDARQELGTLFDPDLYPSAEDLRRKLEPTLRLSPVPSAEMVESFLADVVGSEAQAMLRESVDNASVEAVVRAAQEAVAEVRERLGAICRVASGEQQRFHASHLEALRRTLALVKGLPLPDEAQRQKLGRALEEVSGLLKDLTAERVRLSRKNEAVAESLRLQVAEADARLAEIDKELGL